MHHQIKNSCLLLIALLMISICTDVSAEQRIVVGFNLPLSGDRMATGQSTKEGADLLQEQLNSEGGISIAGVKHKVEFIYADNRSTPNGALNAALDLITKQKVLGIVGPNASSNAIPAGGICESFKTPMISPTSTNPKTTLNRPYVFRACFLDNFQGEVMANFAKEDLGAQKAGVLYNIASAYPKGLAEFFKASFESKSGKGTVVAFESFLSNEKDLSSYIKKIADSGADVLFVPQYAHEIPGIVKQARQIGWNKPILGGDAWESTDLMPNCGELCKGLFFSSHFGAIGAKGITKAFVDQYQKKYNQIPTGYAALGYDAANLMLTAINQIESQTLDSLLETRQEIADKIANIKGFEGVTGTLDMNAAGDPIKSAVVIKINDNGEFEAFKTESPTAN